ncbi:HAD family phosphatase [uncultured Anaerococcus sp.]|uniref:HAD family hydrolase n=1 Tax=uncultured Anaerococcus sp. TaxID=293428 RepID=UPI00288B6A32|nr:HAD family phosphatase [uncultured Anaerococcus sp.]
MKYKLVIFDMDGLMFDTEIIYYRSWFDLAHKYNFEFNDKLRKELTGQNEQTIREKLAKILGSLAKADKLRNELNAHRLNILRNNPKSIKKEGLGELLDFLKANKVKIALASSNDREKIDLLLAKEKIRPYFDFIISGDEVEKSKPNPEIFLKAREKFSCKKEESLILEDSYNGYLAAKESGMDYLIIRDKSFHLSFEPDKKRDNLREVIDHLK